MLSYKQYIRSRLCLSFAALVISMNGTLLSNELSKYQIVKAGDYSTSHWRDYDFETSPLEREYIYFIISTLGNKSLTKIWKEKSSLKKAGDQIDHIHPLKFLMVVFTNEDLKVAVANLKESYWVWGEFKKGLFTSLSEEQAKDNLTFEFIEDFAYNIGIDPFLILPSTSRGDWDELISLLIKNVPREGDPTRYDM